LIRSGKLSLAFRTSAAALLLVACSQATPSANAMRGPHAPTMRVVEPDDTQQIDDLAERGRYEELAHVVEALPQTPESQEFATSIQTYRDHLAERRETRREAFEEARDEALSLLADGKLEDALIKVISAHSLAEDPDRLLASEEIAGLIQRVVTMAEQAQANEDFVESLSLYRLLDLLYEKTREYHDEYEDAADHIRVLQLYNPEMLRSLYRQRAERLGNEEELALFDEADDQELEDWTVKLDGIQIQMLGQSFARAAEGHVTGIGYAELVRGAAEGLSTMIQTDGLEGIFPGLANEEQVNTLQAALNIVIEDLGRPGRRLQAGAAMAIITEIMQINSQTVNLPQEVVVYELTTGGIGELDPFSAVIWPEELRQFSTSISGRLVGIGVQIQKIDGKLTVVTPIEGTPAMEAGLRPNDVIARVNGDATGTWSVDRAVREITGEENTDVTITILREGIDPFDVTLTRRSINVESIKGFRHRDEGGWDYWIDRDAGIGYIRMSQFLRQTAEDMDTAVAQMQQEGEINAIVLDLRFNPGGLLSTAIDVVDRFVDQGRIVSTVDGNGRTTSSQSASRRNTYDNDIQLVVLINQGSASASEIVSGALQDYHRATIIGVNSYGKGSVQDIYPIGTGDALFKCTTQHYALPSGRIIHRTDEATVWGIQPDLEVEMTNSEVADWLEARRDADIIYAPEDRDADNPQTNPEDILTSGMDAQLEAAVLLIRARQFSAEQGLAQRPE